MSRSLLVLLALAVSLGGVWLPRQDLITQREPQDRLTPFERAKAERLLSDRLPCLGCHAIDGAGGRLGPDLASVGERLAAEDILQRVADPQGVRRGSVMPRVSMPAPWRLLLVRYLAERGGEPTRLEVEQLAGAQPIPLSSIPESDGAVLYARFCAPCHGESGRGDGPNAAFLPVAPAAHADGDAMNQRTDDALFDTIHRGGYVMNRHQFMPPYGETLRPQEIRALVRYIRTLCACSGPSWSIDGGDVAAR